MGLQELWFVLIAVLFLGFFVLEGFDFGVGMLMEFFGARRQGRPRAAPPARVLNTIGPVWDGNEVWLITAGGAMFAAFPGMVRDGVLRAVPAAAGDPVRHDPARRARIEWRGKIDDPAWRRWADVGIAIGSWLPAFLWGVAFACLVRGLPIDADKQVHLSIGDVLNAYTLLGGLATAWLFLFYGAVFVALKTEGAVRDDAFRFARWSALPVIVLAAGFGLWTQLAHGNDWTWMVLAVAVIALLTAVTLVWSRGGDGWAFVCTMVVVAAVVVLLFGSMYPNLVPSTLNPEWSLTIYNASSTPYTLKIMTWAALIFAPLVMLYQGWTYWVFRQRISADRDTRIDRAVEASRT